MKRICAYKDHKGVSMAGALVAKEIDRFSWDKLRISFFVVVESFLKQRYLDP